MMYARYTMRVSIQNNYYSAINHTSSHIRLLMSLSLTENDTRDQFTAHAIWRPQSIPQAIAVMVAKAYAENASVYNAKRKKTKKSEKDRP